MQHKQERTIKTGHATSPLGGSDKRRPSARAVLMKQVRQHNESSSGTGVSKLRRLVAGVVRSSVFAEAGKPLLRALESNKPESAVEYARELLSQSYDSWSEHFIHSQVALLVKKYPFPASEEVATENGLKKFLTGERRNRHMNRVLKTRRNKGLNLSRSKGSRTLHCVRNYMMRLLGDSVDWREVASLAEWGPGANVGVTGQIGRAHV